MKPDNRCTLAIDQGTQSSRALLFDDAGRQIAGASQKIGLNRIDRHHVEQDGNEILASLHKVITEILGSSDTVQATAAGLATQRSSVIAWNRQTGEALSPVLSWQDRRAHAWLETLAGRSADIHRITGLPLTPHYGASKLRWLLHHNSKVQDAARNGTLAMGPLAAFIVANLTFHYPGLVDHANASRTQLWNLERTEWDSDLLEVFGIEKQWLPMTCPIRSAYGMLHPEKIPLKAVNGDQTAALHADGGIARDTVVVNLGSGGFVLKPTGSALMLHDALLSGLSDSVDGEQSYLLEGTVNGAGAALRWAEEQHGLETSPAAISDALQRCPAPQLLFVNSVGGYGSPWWMEGPSPCWRDAVGKVVSRPEKTAAIASLVESILFLVMHNLSLLQAISPGIRQIHISGGLSGQDLLCQKLANLAGLPVMRSNQPEATARGIAWLAAGKPASWIRSSAVWFHPGDDGQLSQRYDDATDLLKEMRCNS
jgi:glycerol kinase